MLTLSKKKRPCNITKCVEEDFFRTSLVIALGGCLIVLIYDLFIGKQSQLNIRFAFLFVQIIAVALYGIRKIHFQKMVVPWVICIAGVITFRGLITNDFNEITCLLLITIGFMSAILAQGKWLIIANCFILICLVAVLFKDRSIDVQYQLRNAIPYLGSFAIITICSGVLKMRYVENQKKLTEMVGLLNRKNEHINRQHALLVESHGQLTEANENLERIISEKTSRITEKNIKLSEIAHANAHQVRGPLARILGLLNLASMEPGRKEFYLEKITYEAIEMDLILFKLTRDIEANIHQ